MGFTQPDEGPPLTTKGSPDATIATVPNPDEKE
jgi:hypothetical protein